MVEIIPADSEKGKRVLQIVDLDAKLRGKYLIASTVVEDVIADIIVTHFFPQSSEKSELLNRLVLQDSGLTFRRKLEIFQSLLDLKHPELNAAHSEHIKKVDGIIAMRNSLAHHKGNISTDYLLGKELDRIELLSYKNGEQKIKQIPVKEFNQKLDECSRVAFALLELKDKIIAKNQ